MSTREPQRILVATDFSSSSAAAVAYAELVARRFGASLTLLHVIEPPLLLAPEANVLIQPALTEERKVAEARLETALRGLRAGEVEVGGRVDFGYPADVIVEAANSGRFDLVVTGTHGRRGLAHLFLGSVAEKVVRGARIPVLTVREQS